ncbi:epiphycan [Ambystoma mexicanum]|uniref:epiphycan n=1 Tax=Ambystoma mexicanum TaxID=8296 RepID=UPI0037E7E4C0
MMTCANFFLGLLLLRAFDAAPQPDPIYDTDIDFDDVYDYGEGPHIDQPQIEIGTILPIVDGEAQTSSLLTEEAEEEESTSKLIDGSSPQGPGSPGVLGPETSAGLPTCLLCTCMSTTVYCDDHELDNIPPLPKATTHFYSRYNKINRITKNDFANQNNLKKIDLTSNVITEIDEDAFRGLPNLEELVLRDNKIRQLPELPSTMTFIDVSNNRLGRKGIKEEAFKDMDNLRHLYLSANSLDHIPLPLPESLQSLHLQDNNIQELHEDTFCNVNDVSYARRALEDIRLDGNPINLSNTPQAFMCLPRLPIGRLV